jgi:proteasome lid subunit RPN8/RPN11
MQHASSGVNGLDRKEVGGVLLGRAFRAADGTGYHVAVEYALPDRLGTSRATTFDFTHESWAALVKEAEDKYPNLRIVGWYHSHPGYKAFFSPPDRQSQLTYFNTPWRVGLVVDPIHQEGMFFVAADNEEVVELPGFYERLGQEHKSIIRWRNWAKSGRSAGPLLLAPVPASRLQPLPWTRITASVAVFWAILVSLMLLLMAWELGRVQKELDSLRPAVQEMNTRSVSTPATRLTPSPRSSPTPLPTMLPPPTELDLLNLPRVPIRTRSPLLRGWW